MQKFLFICCLTLLTSLAQAAPILIRANVVDFGNTHRIFADVYVPRLARNTTVTDLKISYFIKAAANSNEILRQDTVSLQNYLLNGGSVTFSFDIPATGVRTAILFIKVTDTQMRQDAQEDFLLGGGNTFAGIVNSKTNIIGEYAKQGDSLFFLGAENQDVYVYRLPQNFQAAFAPMQTEGLNASPELRTDSMFVVKTNTNFCLKSKGLYFAQLDTNSSNGTGFKITEKEFPKYKTVYQLIEPLLYISEYSEISPINAIPVGDAAAKKRALDRYWLELAKDETKAKKMIRAYYQRVAEANEAFTTYKEGWKTDKGMIYIIFGKPDVIQKLQGQEQWIYRGYGQEIKFTFIRRNNQFTTQHYELMRNENYKDTWYSMVERWRMGFVTR